MSLDADAAVRSLRVALIGCGKMGLHHLKAIAATKRAVVVGVADPAASPEELRPLLPETALITNSATELITTARPDVVHIVTPPATHTELALLAIDAGCHVYVEKPFTLTRADAERVLSRAATRGVVVCAGHQVLFEPSALVVKDSVRAIGEVVHLESYFSFRMVRRTITRVDQTKDILPHAVYPIVEHLPADGNARIEIAGLTADASGGVYAILRRGRVTAVLMVTLNGRPVEQYLQIVGTNGSLRADSGAGATRLVGQGSGPGALLTPFRRAWQSWTGGASGVAQRFLSGGSYPGLAALLGQFYDAIRTQTPPPLSPQSIVDTVDICERIGAVLDEAEQRSEARAKALLQQQEAALGAVHKAFVLVTGGTGLLGRATVEELRRSGFGVRVVSRRLPPYSARVAGVEYIAGDLSRGLPPEAFRHIDAVVHAAAETAGGKAEHQKNSIDATRLLITSAVAANVRRMIHVSSLAVLKTSRSVGGPVDEATPVDRDNISRGPYVWGKTESEMLARQLGDELGFPVKIIRPGPLVDYRAFEPPGRLGREVGPLFVAIGPKRGLMSVCDVSTAARVIRSYVEDFESAPAILNLVDGSPETRRDLLARFLARRPDLKVWWVPAILLRALSGPLKLAQRIALGSTQPVDVAAAFATEQYRTGLAARTIARAAEITPVQQTITAMDVTQVSG
jgi:predicted dehydrogenase/nucleoside-diphosphate-sugar epimerase